MSPADSGWERLHPLTPLLRGGKFLLIMAGLVGQQGFRQEGVPPRYLGLLALAATAVAVAVGYVSWRRTGYRLTDTELQVDSGVLTRTERRVPLARLQAVEVVRPVIGRVLGLAELRLEVVGGGSSEAPLAYLTESDAHELRSRMLTGSGPVAPSGTQAVTAPDVGKVLVVVPTHTLVLSLLRAAPTVVLGLLLITLLVVSAVDSRAAGPLALFFVSVALPAGAAVVKRFLAEYGFTVSETEGGLRLTRGLLDTRASSIPDGRVQTVRILEPLLWRSRDWVRVEVDVAGYASGSGDQTTSTALLPVAPRALGLALAARVLGSPLPVAQAPVPPRARWRAPLSHRRLHAGLDNRHLVTTYGVLTTTTDIVPLAKIQSMRMTVGPWQRRLGLATLHADSAGRRLKGGSAPHRDAAEAAALMEELAMRTRAARLRE
ncbi:MAG: PH domain-containing protein [Mycobacteriales bacterium]